MEETPASTAHVSGCDCGGKFSALICGVATLNRLPAVLRGFLCTRSLREQGSCPKRSKKFRSLILTATLQTHGARRALLKLWGAVFWSLYHSLVFSFWFGEARLRRLASGLPAKVERKHATKGERHRWVETQGPLLSQTKNHCASMQNQKHSHAHTHARTRTRTRTRARARTHTHTQTSCTADLRTSTRTNARMHAHTNAHPYTHAQKHRHAYGYMYTLHTLHYVPWTSASEGVLGQLRAIL